MNIYTLYWIKYPKHTNPLTEGYIGITYQLLEQRLNEHKHNTKNRLLKNRCRKENVIILPIRENLTKEEAESLEEQYRPLENIGWNLNKGGNLPPSRKGKISPKNLLKGNQRTEAQKKASKKHSEIMKGKSFPKKRIKKDYTKICNLCQNSYWSTQTRSKFCSRKCSSIHVNDFLSQNRKKFGEILKEKWKNPEYKEKLSLAIKQGMAKSKEKFVAGAG